MLIKEDILPLLYNGDPRKIEILNDNWRNKSNGETIMNNVILCINTIHIGQSINYNFLQIFFQTSLDNNSVNKKLIEETDLIKV